MHHLCWMNTKVLFKYMRYDPALNTPERHLPVSIHINYHPEKEQRMRSVVDFYFEVPLACTSLVPACDLP